MKSSQITLGAIVIAVIAAAAFYLTQKSEPAAEAASEAAAPAATEGTGAAALSETAPECTEYTLKAGAWVCTSGN